jgi:class 3 adenylate cyclase
MHRLKIRYLSTAGDPVVDNGSFQPDQTYEHVFFLLVDAAGHSSIVLNNPRDLVGRAMDLFDEAFAVRLRTVAQRHRCARAQRWRWAGDGGLLVVHDEDESVTRDTALDFVKHVLDVDLPHLRDEFRVLGIRGELHVRIAVHRGTVRYRGAGLEGTIYSPDINFVVHLERATPPDTAAMSAEVYQVSGDFAAWLEPVGTFEDRAVYLYAPDIRPGGAGSARTASTAASPCTPTTSAPARRRRRGWWTRRTPR